MGCNRGKRSTNWFPSSAENQTAPGKTRTQNPAESNSQYPTPYKQLIRRVSNAQIQTMNRLEHRDRGANYRPYGRSRPSPGREPVQTQDHNVAETDAVLHERRRTPPSCVKYLFSSYAALHPQTCVTVEVTDNSQIISTTLVQATLTCAAQNRSKDQPLCYSLVYVRQPLVYKFSLLQDAYSA